MVSRKQEVAALAGVTLAEVFPATAQEIRKAYADSARWEVVEVATAEPANYWRVGSNKYYLDDPYFGDVVAIDDLDYNSDLGLYPRNNK